RGRTVIGNDINSLAVFVSRVKTTPLTISEIVGIRMWAEESQSFRCTSNLRSSAASPNFKLHNMNISRARYIKKIIVRYLESADSLQTVSSQEFARCVVLKTAQWALDGRNRHASAQEFRDLLAKTAEEMLNDLEVFVANGARRFTKGFVRKQRTLIHGDASLIHEHPLFLKAGFKVKLVLTSPPYPGVHVLYHRWQ